MAHPYGQTTAYCFVHMNVRPCPLCDNGPAYCTTCGHVVVWGSDCPVCAAEQRAICPECGCGLDGTLLCVACERAADRELEAEAIRQETAIHNEELRQRRKERRKLLARKRHTRSLRP